MSLAISTARNLSRGEALAVAGAEAAVSRAALVAQSVLDRHFLQVDGQVSGLREWLERGFISTADPQRASLALEQLSTNSYTHRNLMLADARGEVWASAIPARIGLSLPLPRSVLDAAAQDGPAVLHGPLRNMETGLSMLMLLRRVGHDAEGRPVLAVAEIPNAVVTGVLAPMVNPAEMRVRLENRDGLVLAAGPGQTFLVGQVLPPAALPQALPFPLPQREGQVLRHASRQGPGEVFAAARPIMLPGLFAVVTLPDSVALAGWPALRFSILAGAGIAALLVVALAAALFFAAWNGQRAAREREMADARLRAAIDSLPDGFVLWDAEDRLVICNSRYRDINAAVASLLQPGLRFAELARGWVTHGVLATHGTDPDSFIEDLVRRHRDAAGHPECELQDGRWLRIAQRRMANGGLVVVVTEITELKQAMDALASARDAADQATAAKSNLLAHVSHELRTPLSSLLRLSDALQRQAGLSAANRHQAGLVGATARHLLALANEVLDLAAMEAQSLTLHPEVAATQEIFLDAMAMVRPLAEAKRIALRFTADGLPSHVEVDATRLRQMALNLLSNAVKFTPEGSEVRLQVRAEADHLVFDVSDQGAGVPEAERAHLFRDFTRLASSRPEGSGLGLSITARLAALMGGRIGCADAEPGPGARFWIELPLRAAAPPAEAAAEPLPARRLRVLAVDDAPSNLSVLRALLAQADLELETVTEGRAALEAVEVAAREGRPFDVVLMDVMMPEMDGKETTRRLRALPGTMGRMPVIAVTASAFPEDIAETRAAGMDSHVIKPVDRALLLRALAAAVPAPAAPGAASDALEALRPMLLAELNLRLNQLDLALREGAPTIPIVHALAGTVGHLGAPQQVTRTRRVLQALREEDPAALRLARALLDELRFSFPESADPAAA